MPEPRNTKRGRPRHNNTSLGLRAFDNKPIAYVSDMAIASGLTETTVRRYTQDALRINDDPETLPHISRDTLIPLPDGWERRPRRAHFVWSTTRLDVQNWVMQRHQESMAYNKNP
jgi:hypothetical protein